MAKLEFEDISFEEQKETVSVIFLRLFYFDIKKQELKRILSNSHLNLLTYGLLKIPSCIN